MAEQMKKRLDWLDIAKGIGMICVVWGHTYCPGWIRVYVFHMAFFMILSGYTYNARDSVPRFILKKVKSIYIPFVFWNILFTIMQVSRNHAGEGLKPVLVECWTKIRVILLALDKNGQYLGATWFLASLFLICITYKVLDTLLPVKYLNPVVLLVFFSGLAVLGFFVTLPYMQSRTLILSPFYALGVLLKYYWKETERFLKLTLGFLCLFLFLVLAPHTAANMGKNTYRNPHIFILTCLTMSTALICFSLWLGKRKFVAYQILKVPLRLIGKHTLDILIWQFIMFRIVTVFQFLREGASFRSILNRVICGSTFIHNTDGINCFIYLAAGIVLPILWCTLLRSGPWGWILQKLHIV